MARKPSATKQIATLLDTEDKTLQVERLKQLLSMARAPVVAVTVLLSKGEVELAITSPNRLGPEDVKRVLQLGVDHITEQVTLMKEGERQLQADKEEAEQASNSTPG